MSTEPSSARGDTKSNFPQCILLKLYCTLSISSMRNSSRCWVLSAVLSLVCGGVTPLSLLLLIWLLLKLNNCILVHRWNDVRGLRKCDVADQTSRAQRDVLWDDEAADVLEALSAKSFVGRVDENLLNDSVSWSSVKVEMVIYPWELVGDNMLNDMADNVGNDESDNNGLLCWPWFCCCFRCDFKDWNLDAMAVRRS